MLVFVPSFSSLKKKSGGGVAFSAVMPLFMQYHESFQAHGWHLGVAWSGESLRLDISV